jgi:hypothetical protein
VHFAKDELYSSSLVYFVNKAVRCWQDADYRIIIQRDDANTLNRSDIASWTAGLPSLPYNARYVLHQNECMDWGTVGWLLRLPSNHSDAVNTGRYRYFIILNTSVKGPILPYYLEAAMDRDNEVQCTDSSPPAVSRIGSGPDADQPHYLFSWFHVFLSRIDSVTRYVGCTWSCEMRAHIQSYVVAFDFVALQVLWQASGWSSESHSIAITEDITKWAAVGGIRALNETGKAFQCFPN